MQSGRWSVLRKQRRELWRALGIRYAAAVVAGLVIHSAWPGSTEEEFGAAIGLAGIGYWAYCFWRSSKIFGDGRAKRAGLTVLSIVPVVWLVVFFCALRRLSAETRRLGSEQTPPASASAP
jgi:hypothetical protein